MAKKKGRRGEPAAWMAVCMEGGEKASVADNRTDQEAAFTGWKWVRGSETSTRSQVSTLEFVFKI